MATMDMSTATIINSMSDSCSRLGLGYDRSTGRLRSLWHFGARFDRLHRPARPDRQAEAQDDHSPADPHPGHERVDEHFEGRGCATRFETCQHCIDVLDRPGSQAHVRHRLVLVLVVAVSYTHS